MTPLRPDETLYSAAARLSRYIGAPGRAALQFAFFGEDRAVFDEMPVGMARIVESGAFPAISVGDAVREWTLLPYYAHFAEPWRARAAEVAMVGGAVWPHEALGSWTTLAPPADRLRFCPECHEVMRGDHAEVWWRRTHQLPSSLVCADHGGPLRLSTLDRAARRRRYVAATLATCPFDAPMVVSEDDQRVRSDLVWLARQGDLVLNDLGRVHPDERRELYLQALSELGMLNRLGEANLSRVAAAMDRYWGSTLDHWSALRLDGRCTQGWLHRLLVGEHGSPPLHHLLLEGMLAASLR